MRRFAKSKPQREPTIALINIVFLMLVFFMVAGTLAQPLDPDLKLVETPRYGDTYHFHGLERLMVRAG